MTHLKTINFRGFKSIGDMDDLELGPLNVLVGETSSGKTNLLLGVQTLWYLHQGYFAGMVDHSGDPQWLLHRKGEERAPEAVLRFEFAEPFARYQLQLESHRGETPRPRRVAVESESGKVSRSIPWDAHIDDLPWRQALPGPVAEFIGGFSVHRGYDAPEVGVVYQYGQERTTAPHVSGGSAVAEYLHWLNRTNPDRFELIGAVMSEIDPSVLRLQFVEHPANSNLAMLAAIDRDTGGVRLCNEESRALRRALKTVTLLMQPEETRPSMFVMDEPCLGLSPRGQRAMGSMIRKLSEQSQFIIATQSPAFYSEFLGANEIMVGRSGGQSTFLPRRRNRDMVKEAV